MHECFRGSRLLVDPTALRAVPADVLHTIGSVVSVFSVAAVHRTDHLVGVTSLRSLRSLGKRFSCLPT